MTAAPGQMITPRIRLEHELGAGGMGSVWVATNLALGVQVAVKLISPDVVTEGSVLERFTREATLAAKIKSPHVVQIFDHGMSGNAPFIVMELMEGESLQDHLDRVGRLPFDVVRDVTTQTCSALAEAHRLGIVHRDIKPDNLFLIHHDQTFVKVLDFGIAKTEASVKKLTATHTMIGTPHYMSPEQFLAAKNLGPGADLWSLGVVVFEMLTGDVPFEGDSVTALAMSVCNDPAKRISAIRPDLPKRVDDFLERAFAKDPQDRFPDAATFARELTVALSSQGASHHTGSVATAATIEQVARATALGRMSPRVDESATHPAYQPARTAPVSGTNPGVATIDGGAPFPRQGAPARATAPTRQALTASDYAATSMTAPPTVPANGTAKRGTIVAVGAGIAAVLGLATAGMFALSRQPTPQAPKSAPESAPKSAPAPEPEPEPESEPPPAPDPVTADTKQAPPATSPATSPAAPSPKPKPKPAPAPAPKKPSCEGNSAYYRDASGTVQIRPECM